MDEPRSALTKADEKMPDQDVLRPRDLLQNTGTTWSYHMMVAHLQFPEREFAGDRYKWELHPKTPPLRKECDL